jgi:hypothetical protein
MRFVVERNDPWPTISKALESLVFVKAVRLEDVKHGLVERAPIAHHASRPARLSDMGEVDGYWQVKEVKGRRDAASRVGRDARKSRSPRAAETIWNELALVEECERDSNVHRHLVVTQASMVATKGKSPLLW